MAKGRLYKPRAFALGLLCHIEKLPVYISERKTGHPQGCPVFRSPYIRKPTQVAALAIASTCEEQ